MSDNFAAIKAPEEILDFTIDWSVEMAKTNPTDVVATSAWTLEDKFADNLVIQSQAMFQGAAKDHFKLPNGVDDFLLPDGVSFLLLPVAATEKPDNTVVRVSGGGRLGTRHYLTNRITTASGQRHQRTIIVTIRTR